MKLVICGLCALVAAASSAAGAQQDQFDLKCQGTADVLRGSMRSTEPFNQLLHLDLVRRQYCVDDCSGISDLARVDPLEITLVNIPRRGGATDMRMEKRVIDRRSGELSIFDFDAAKLSSVSVKAKCSPQPFTPFPSTKF